MNGNDRLTRAAAHDEVRTFLPDLDAPAVLEDAPKLACCHSLEPLRGLRIVSMPLVIFYPLALALD
jgi:hypothetical protein